MTHYRQTFHSLPELSDYVETHKSAYGYASSSYRSDWAGASFKESIDMLTMGWPEGLQQALPIAESAITHIEKVHPIKKARSRPNVVGGSVIVPNYLSGIPTMMMHRETAHTSNRVVAMIAAICCPGAISSDEMMRRGTAITALALALERAGLNTELWIDCSFGNTPTKQNQIRVQVKGAGDIVDASKIAYAVGHPSFARNICYPAWSEAKYPYYNGSGSGTAGIYIEPTEFETGVGSEEYHSSWGKNYGLQKDLPDGTIYIPAMVDYMRTNTNNAEEFVLAHLSKLGLIER